MTALEENGGGDGNSSVAELEVRVDTLEERATDHETRITTAEAAITGNENNDVYSIKKSKTNFWHQRHYIFLS